MKGHLKETVRKPGGGRKVPSGFLLVTFPGLLQVSLAWLLASAVCFADAGWHRVTYTPESATFNAVCKTSNGTFIAVGNNGTINVSSAPFDTLVPVRGSRFYGELLDVQWNVNTGAIAVGADNAILRSVNEGQSWTPLNAPTQFLRCVGMSASGVVVVGGMQGLWKNAGSIDTPQWQRITTLDSITGIFSVDENAWLIGTRNGKLWRTTNAFASIDTVLTAPRAFPTSCVMRGDSIYVCMGSSIGLSTDAGATFEVKQCASGGDTIRGIDTYSKDQRVVIAVDGSAGGAGMSFDGSLAFWRSSLSNPGVRDVAFNDSMCIAVCTDGAYMIAHVKSLRSRDSVERNLGRPVLRTKYQSWLRVVGSRQHLVGLVNFGPSTVEESVDSGQTWSVIWHDSIKKRLRDDFIEPFDMLALNDGSTLLVTDTVFNISPDNGYSRAAILKKGLGSAQWNLVLSTQVDSNIYGGLTFGDGSVILWSQHAVWLSYNNADTWSKYKNFPGDVYTTIAYCKGVFLVSGDSSIYLSDDLGRTWKKRSKSPLQHPALAAFSNGTFVAVDYFRESLGTGHGCFVYISNDTGATWQQTLVDTADKRAYFARNIATSQVNGNAVICGSYGLAYTTTDYGSSWTKHAIPTPEYQTLVHPSITTEGWARVSGFANHIWEYDFNSPTSDVSESALAVLDLCIWPNPTKTTVNVACREVIKELTFVDVSGRVVKHILSAEQNTQLQIDVATLASGTYFIRSRTEAGISTAVFTKTD